MHLGQIIRNRQGSFFVVTECTEPAPGRAGGISVEPIEDVLGAEAMQVAINKWKSDVEAQEEAAHNTVQAARLYRRWMRARRRKV